MYKSGAKAVTNEQKQRKVEPCHDISERQDGTLGCGITGNEPWVSQHDPEMKQQSAQLEDANSPCPKKDSKSRVKTMLLTFFGIKGTVHYEFVSTEHNVNQD